MLLMESAINHTEHLRMREVVEPSSLEISKSQLDIVLGNLLWVDLLEQRVRSDDLQRSLPTSGSLGFCDVQPEEQEGRKDGLVGRTKLHTTALPANLSSALKRHREVR